MLLNAFNSLAKMPYLRSTGSGATSQELHNHFSNLFKLWIPCALGSCDPMLTFTLCGQSEVGPYLKKNTTHFQIFFSY